MKAADSFTAKLCGIVLLIPGYRIPVYTILWNLYLEMYYIRYICNTFRVKWRELVTFI